jgi:hypothetical protein
MTFCTNVNECYCDCINNDEQYNSLCVYKSSNVNINIFVLFISISVFLCILVWCCKIRLYNSLNPRLTNNLDNNSNNILLPSLMLTTNYSQYQRFPDYQTYIYEYNTEHNTEHNINELNKPDENEVLPKYNEIIIDNDTQQPPSYLYVNDINQSPSQSPSQSP